MSKTTTVSLVLKLSGTAGKDLSRITTEQINQTKQLQVNWNLTTQSSVKFTDQIKRATTEVKTVNTATVDLVRTNRMLEGVNRQLSIQTRLISQQLKSQNRDYQLQTRMLSEQARHAQDLQRALAEAARNQRDIKNNTPKGGGNSMLGVSGGVMGGAAAAYAVVRSPLERARSFETKMFDATTAITSGYDGMSRQQAKASKLELQNYAKDAVRQGHGSVDGMADSAEILAASGLFQSVKELKAPLMAIAKTAFSSGSSEQDIAVLTQQLRLFGIKPEDMQRALDHAVASGYAGGFEIKDMARLLPEVLPYATKAGYSGFEGLDEVLTHMQLARKNTGIPSEAATNMKDLYYVSMKPSFKRYVGQYITPQDGDPLKKIGLRGNRLGLDVDKYLNKEYEKGVGFLPAISKLVNRQLSLNPEWRALQEEFKSLPEDDINGRAKVIKGMSDRLSGSVFGQIFHDQQSLSGFMSFVTGTENGEYQRISDRTKNGDGVTDNVFSLKKDEEPAQAHGLEQEHILTQIKVYDSVKKTLGNFEQGLTDTMQANQALTAAAYAAATALTVVAAAGLGSRIAGGAGNFLGAAAATTWGALRTPVGTTGGVMAGSMAGRLAMATGVGFAGVGGWYLGSKISENLSDETNHNIGGTIATIMSHLPDWMGVGDTAREALAAEMSVLSGSLPSQNEQMIQQNERLIKAVEGLQIPVSSDMLPLSDKLKQQANRGLPYW